MKIIEELPLVGRARQLRHTYVLGADEKHYKVLTFALYDFKVSPEFATHETNVEIVNENGARFVLDQPLIKRFFSQDEALAYHQELLEAFDSILNLKAPEKKEHKPAPKKEAPKAEEPKPAAEKKDAPKAEEKKPEPPKAEEKKPEPPKAEEKKPEPPPAEKKDPPPAGDKPATS